MRTLGISAAAALLLACTAPRPAEPLPSAGLHGCAPHGWVSVDAGGHEVSYETAPDRGRRLELERLPGAGALEQMVIDEIGPAAGASTERRVALWRDEGRRGPVYGVVAERGAGADVVLEGRALFQMNDALYRLVGMSPGGLATGFADVHRVVALCLERRLSAQP